MLEKVAQSCCELRNQGNAAAFRKWSSAAAPGGSQWSITKVVDSRCGAWQRVTIRRRRMRQKSRVLTLNEDGTRIVGLSRDGKLILFDWATLRIRANARQACRLAEDDMPGDPYGNPDFVMSANGSDLIAINGKGRAAWLDPQTGCVKRRQDLGEARNYSGIAVNLRAGLIALSDYRDVVVQRLDGAGMPIRLPSSDAMRHMTFTPDGSALLTAGSDGAVRKYLLHTGVSQAWSYEGGVTGLAANADGRFAVGLFGSYPLLSCRTHRVALLRVIHQNASLHLRSDPDYDSLERMGLKLSN